MGRDCGSVCHICVLLTPVAARSHLAGAKSGLQLGQGLACRGICDAIHAGLPEMPLKGANHRRRQIVVSSCDIDRIPVFAKRVLQVRNCASVLARRQARPRSEVGSWNPVANAGRVQKMPGKFLAGIILSKRRYIRVR